MEKKFAIKFYDVFDYYSRSYKVAKFSIMELYLDVRDVIHAKGHTKHANCGFPTNIPRVFHVEITWKRMFPRRFNVECTRSVRRVTCKLLDFFVNVILFYDEERSF